MSMFDYDARPVSPVPVLVGTTASRGAYAIRDFLSRNGYAFEWVDAGQPEAVRAVLGVAEVEPSALPLCILPDGSRLASATVEQVAAGLGMVAAPSRSESKRSSRSSPSPVARCRFPVTSSRRVSGAHAARFGPQGHRPAPPIGTSTLRRENSPVARIFITGSTDGLGRGAASVLMGEGHDVVLHARTLQRAAALSDLAPDASGVVIGDLSSAAETRELADQVNNIGRMDAVIHNAGVFLEPSRSATADGHPKILAVNTLAPYLLTALINRPDRLIYLSSGLHQTGAGSLRDIDWTGRQWNARQAYAESKLQVTALALTLARAWPDVLSNAVDPGWVPTKMGGPAATGDLELGYLTQTWLAVSNDTAASVSGGYWYHRQRQAPAAEARDPAFQDQLMDRLAGLTGVALF
jgi:NAD(P)-dependent dehydrogenase (short-subunit alcohol dehydrogenase family)